MVGSLDERFDENFSKMVDMHYAVAAIVAKYGELVKAIVEASELRAISEDEFDSLIEAANEFGERLKKVLGDSVWSV